MGIRTLIWGFFFFGACIAALLVSPIWGIVGYIGHYVVGPERQWWASPVNGLELRYSFTLAGCTGIGILLHRLRSDSPQLLHPQMRLLLAFLGVVWLTTIITPDTVGRYGVAVDHPSVKLTKITIFTLMLAHVATTRRDLNRVIGILVIGAFVLGQKAYELPRSSFVGGRLESVGGADFEESNFLAAFLVGVLPIVGVQFLRSKSWIKFCCLVSGVFVMNALVLCRSRGAFLALAVTAMVAALNAPKEHRSKVYAALLLAMLGGLYLADEQFLNRMTTITADQENMDSSSDRRLEAWKGGLKMFAANPLGVGTGNWYQTIGRYNPVVAGLDSHSTYIKLLAEQGIFGASIFAAMIINAFRILQRVDRRSRELPSDLAEDFRLLRLGFTLSLTGFLLCCGLITLIYMEALWWFLLFPVCLERSLDDAEREWRSELACTS